MNRWMDGQTDEPTDGWTSRPLYADISEDRNIFQEETISRKKLELVFVTTVM